MKKFILSAIISCLFVLFAEAQEVKTYELDLSNAADIAKIRLTSSEKNVNNYEFSLSNFNFIDAPFFSFAVKIEGDNLSENLNAGVVSYGQNQVKMNDLHHFEHSEEDENHIFVSELLFFDKKTERLILRLDLKQPIEQCIKKIKIRLFNPTKSDFLEEKEDRSLVACDLPPLVSRKVWGKKWTLTDDKIYSGSPSFTTVTHLIIHHSESSNTSADWAATVATIFDYHVTTNGWADIAYNYLIAPNGKLFVGRGGGKNVVGSHFCKSNANTMGVCLLGSYTSVAPPDTMIRTLEKLLAWKTIDAKINPMTSSMHNVGVVINHIDGHRTGCSTSCPGDKVFPLLPTVRKNVDALVKNNCNPKMTTSLFEKNGDDNFFAISPNPISQENPVLNLHFLEKANDFSLKILDLQGKEVFLRNIQSAENEQIALPFLAKGIYFVQLSDDSKRWTKKIVIE